MELNCIQKLFLKGRHEASCMEKLADNILAFPRCLWADYIEDKNNVDGGYKYVSSDVRVPGGAAGGIAIIGIVIVAVLATPFLLIGGIIKGCVIYADSDAQQHNDDIQRQIYSTF